VAPSEGLSGVIVTLVSDCFVVVVVPLTVVAFSTYESVTTDVALSMSALVMDASVILALANAKGSGEAPGHIKFNERINTQKHERHAVV
jgi:hypothetical protein